ncbi:hypothetical protein NMY22_g11031 [Coprinellus aureogranulatus]|nr:hypothetical protein NMY22_g11031 [Coprinellus aureogranulatus]
MPSSSSQSTAKAVSTPASYCLPGTNFIARSLCQARSPCHPLPYTGQTLPHCPLAPFCLDLPISSHRHLLAALARSFWPRPYDYDLPSGEHPLPNFAGSGPLNSVPVCSVPISAPVASFTFPIARTAILRRKLPLIIPTPTRLAFQSMLFPT